MYVKEAMAHVMTWDESVYITMFNRQAIQVMGQLVRLELIKKNNTSIAKRGMVLK